MVAPKARGGVKPVSDNCLWRAPFSALSFDAFTLKSPHPETLRVSTLPLKGRVDAVVAP